MDTPSKNKKIFQDALLVSFETRHPGDKKSNHGLAIKAAEHLGISGDRYGNTIRTIPKNIMQRIRTPARHAREFMKEHTTIWATSRTNLNGSRMSGNQYLLMTDKLVEFEEGMTAFRFEWEDRKHKELYSQWGTICAEAPTALNDAYNPDHFPPLEELKKQFEWKVSLEPLWDVADISRDVRLKASKDLVDRCVEGAQRDQAMRMSNAVGSLAERVIDLTSDIAERMDYTPDPTAVTKKGAQDKRKGNNLPKAPTWKKFSDLTDTLEGMNGMFEDDALSETVEKMRDLGSHIEGMGSSEDIRKTLLESEPEREKLKDQLDEIKNTAAPALHRFDEFMDS